MDYQEERAKTMPYGLTIHTQKRLANELAKILDIDEEKIMYALNEITKMEVKRIAKYKSPGS